MQKLIEIKNIFKIYNTGYAKVYALSDVSPVSYTHLTLPTKLEV